MSEAEILFAEHLKELGLPFEAEYKFLRDRKFKFDFALLEPEIAIEIEGAVWVQGRHTRGSGFIKDMEKYNLAAKYGWRVFRFCTDQVLSGYAKEFIKELSL